MEISGIRMLVGIIVSIVAVGGPIVIAWLLIYLLHKNDRRAISIINLVFALLFVLGEASYAFRFHFHGSRPPITPEAHTRAVVLGIISAIILAGWLAGAIGLFFKKGIAWISWVGSVIGTGAAAFSLLAFLTTIIWGIIFPPQEAAPLEDSSNGIIIFVNVIAVIYIALPAVVFLRLLWGLLKIRREVFAAQPLPPVLP